MIQPALSSSSRIEFTRLLAILLDAGIPIVDAMLIIARDSRSRVLKQVVMALYNNLQEGLSLTQAMHNLNKQKQHFPEAYMAGIQAGEASGELVTVLIRLADYLEHRAQVVKQVQAALVYPFIILTVAIAVIGVLMVYVVPKVTLALSSAQKTLPPLTQLVLAISEFFQHYGEEVLLGLLALLVGVWGLAKLKPVQLAWHQGLLRVPLLKHWLRRHYAAYFCRTLSLLLQSGVTVIDALHSCRTGITNQHLQMQLQTVIQLVTEGQGLARVIHQQHLLPEVAQQLLASGEQTSRLPVLLDKAGVLMEQQQQQAVKVGMALLEPLMMLLLGGLVLLIVLAVLMPIFEMNDLVM